MSSDPLDSFFDEVLPLEGEIRKALANMLLPFAAGDRADGRIFLKPGWMKLDSLGKVLIVLLAQMALSTRSEESSAALSPREIEEISDLPGGTIRPKLSELVKLRVAVRDSHGNYSIRSSLLAFERARKLLKIEDYDGGQ